VAVKVREAIRRLRRDGWVQTGQEGSHRQFEHPDKPDKVTVAGHLNDDLRPGTWISIQEQAGWRPRRQ
jgi:predicted RNA binding protein YcfA (HicA-like mRNA interferase family)